MKSLGLILTVLFATQAFAENLPANRCQVYINGVIASPSSHGARGMVAIVKVNWLGNDEHIQRVGFYGKATSVDLGNSRGCGNSPENPDWQIIDGHTSSNLNYGEYSFHFRVSTGSIVSSCGGFLYSWSGAFFVETNKNTYWTNPNMNANEYFYFDSNGFELVTRKGGWANRVSTAREDMRYYNPMRCE
jgi:hypothetical protein